MDHALHAGERAEQSQESTHSPPLTVEEEGLKDEHDLWRTRGTRARDHLQPALAVRVPWRTHSIILAAVDTPRQAAYHALTPGYLAADASVVIATGTHLMDLCS